MRYGEHKAIIAIASLALLEGYLPPRALGLVAEWGALHRDELNDDWTLAEQRAPLKKIKPLEYGYAKGYCRSHCVGWLLSPPQI